MYWENFRDTYFGKQGEYVYQVMLTTNGIYIAKIKENMIDLNNILNGWTPVYSEILDKDIKDEYFNLIMENPESFLMEQNL